VAELSRALDRHGLDMKVTALVSVFALKVTGLLWPETIIFLA
jgi:hypothetical protein